MKILEVIESHKDRLPITHEVMVDDDDYEYLKTYNWIWRDGYAAMKTGRKYYQLHRMVMGVLFKEPIIVDHKDNDHHNCQKYNLRRANRFQNQQNRLTNKNNVLPKGIRQLPSGKYNVRVQAYNKRFVFGAFDTVEEAVEARNNFAVQVHGEFMRPSELL